MTARKRSRRGSDPRRQEALGVVVLLVGIFLLLSLVSYSPTDPPAAFDSAGGEPSNWMGLLGARVAYGMVEQLGRIPPLLLIFLFFLWGWKLLRNQVERDLVYLSLKVLGIELLLSVFLAFPHFLLNASFSYDAAGQIGGGLAGVLVRYTGVVGAPLIWLASVILFLMGAFDLKPGALAGGIARALSRFTEAAGSAAGAAAAGVRGTGWVLGRVLSFAGRLGSRVRGRRTSAAREGAGTGPAGVEESAGEEAPPEGPPPVPEEPRPDPQLPLERGEEEEEPVEDDLTPAPPPPRGSEDYAPPPLDIFSRPAAEERGVDEETMEQQARLLEEKLGSFGVKAEVMGWETGPIITRFEVKPSPGVKVSQIVNLADDLALAMRAKRIRIIAPIPGKAAVGVEIPNPTARIVRLREILESKSFNEEGHTMPLALGHTISGEPFSVDLAKMPHLLIAGTTGSGKSVCINALIASLLFRMGPEECRFIMVDPKMLELGVYNSIPHLITPVVTDPKKSVDALKWTVLEMEDRFNTLAQAMVRDLDQYNAKLASLRAKAEAEGEEERLAGIPDPLPYLVVVVDELADLMVTATADIEGLIQRIAQKARAVGIHLVLATQR
ncbi:MAG: DNA translocase FtsK 4TM domain-containing protein, partial [bacterium]